MALGSALLVLCSMKGCPTSSERFYQATAEAERARQEQATAPLVQDALALSRQIAPQPKECGYRLKSGVQVTDRLDVALTKTSDALYRANNRLVRCYHFNEQIRTSAKDGWFDEQ